MGIDIESVSRKVSDSLIRYSMTSEEAEGIALSIDKDRAFLRLWTQKEAVAKLLGTGIRDDFKHILSQDDYDIETQESERWVMSIASYRFGR